MANKRELLKQRNAVTIQENSAKDSPSLIDEIIEERSVQAVTDQVQEYDNTIYYADPDEFVPYFDSKLRLPLHTGEKRQQMLESISKNGIMEPVICTIHDNRLMSIAGHNRIDIARELGIKVPYLLKKDITVDQQNLICIDTNLLNHQVNEIKVSQLAYLLKVKFDAEKHQGVSSSYSSATGDKIGADYGLSRMQIFRYIKLNNLLRDYLLLIDEKVITMNFGYELSFFPEEVQIILMNWRFEHGLTESALHKIRVQVKQQDITDEEMVIFVKDKLKLLIKTTKEKKQSKSNELTKFRAYVPESVSDADLENYIIRALKAYTE